MTKRCSTTSYRPGRFPKLNVERLRSAGWGIDVLDADGAHPLRLSSRGPEGSVHHSELTSPVTLVLSAPATSYGYYEQVSVSIDPSERSGRFDMAEMVEAVGVSGAQIAAMAGLSVSGLSGTECNRLLEAALARCGDGLPPAALRELFNTAATPELRMAVELVTELLPTELAPDSFTSAVVSTRIALDLDDTFDEFLAHSLALCEDRVMCLRLAGSPMTPPLLLSCFADVRAFDQSVASAVAANRSTPCDTLARLGTTCDDMTVLCTVARNLATPPAVLTELCAHTQDWPVIAAAAGNPSTPRETLAGLAATSDDLNVLLEVVHNRSTPCDVLTDLLEHEDADVTRYADTALCIRSTDPLTPRADLEWITHHGGGTYSLWASMTMEALDAASAR